MQKISCNELIFQGEFTLHEFRYEGGDS